MKVEASWVVALAAIAGPTMALLIYARQLKREPQPDLPPLPAAALVSGSADASPLRWQHRFAALALVALPFLQWLGYMHNRSLAAFLLPLAGVLVVTVSVATLSPRAIHTKPLVVGEWLLWFAVLAALLAAALAAPATGTILVLRGLLMDTAAFTFGSLVIRVAHRRLCLSQ